MNLYVQFGDIKFFVSCVYGNPNPKLRAIGWERLSRIGISRKESWCMVGDYNDILHNSEKLGGPRKGNNNFLPFSNMLSSCDMAELSSTRNGFTWCGKRHDMWIQSKLVRCFGNKSWFKFFPASNQGFLERRGSDHKPVLVNLLFSRKVQRYL